MESILSHIRNNRPIIHCITNYVTANDCANLLLGCGASPVMADAPEEVAEITAASQALLLNLGTLNQNRFAAMLEAGYAANRLGIPIVFDPVGAGASAFRQRAAKSLLSELRITAIRGNDSEIRFLAGASDPAAGVDAALTDVEGILQYAKQLSAKTGAVVAATGEADTVTDGSRTVILHTGHPLMRQITGAGCMLSALTAAFLTAENNLTGCAAAVCAAGLAGMCAAKRMKPSDGNASFRNYLIDAVYLMDDAQLSDAFAQYTEQI